MFLRKLYARSYQWLPLLLGVTCIILAAWLRRSPEFTEAVYRNFIFKGVRWFIDLSFAWLPFPTVILFLAFIFLLHVYKWYRRQLFIYRPWYRGLANSISILVIWFYLAWGFNYSAPGVAEKLNITADALTGRMEDDLFDMALAQAQQARLKCDTTAFYEQEMSPRDLQVIHLAVRDYLRAIGFETPGQPRMRLVSNSGWMRRIGVSGIYFPFSGECHADASYPLLRQWFIVAHEYAHAYGVTHEGECNFVAFAALIKSGQPKFAYAAWFELIGDLMNNSRKDLTPAPLLADRLEMRRNADRYPPLLGRLPEISNDLYLRSQGVEEGIHSYAFTPRLVAAAIQAGVLLNVKP